MKVLTLHQPWASLVALGVKNIETRSWSVQYRGPLAIHAAATTAGFDQLPGDCDGTTEAGWRYGYIGEFQAAYCFRSSDEGTRGDTFLHRYEIDPEPGPCPLGAIVATCTLVDVVPIVGHGSDAHRDANFTTYVLDWADRLRLCDWDGTGWGNENPAAGRYGGRFVEIDDQRPYGDFSTDDEQRYAWLLADIVPVDPPVPFKGGQGLTKTWEPVMADG